MKLQVTKKHAKRRLTKITKPLCRGNFSSLETQISGKFLSRNLSPKNWEYTGNSQRPHLVAKITNEFIYSFLPEDVMSEVRERKKGKKNYINGLHPKQA